MPIDDEDDDMDMEAAMAGEPSLADGGDDDDMDMAAAMAGEPSMGDDNNNNQSDNVKASETLGGNRSIGITSAAQDIGVDITAVLGVAEMKVSNLLKIGRGAVIELNKNVGDTVDLQVTGRLVASGDVVVVDDKLAISITETFKKNITDS